MACQNILQLPSEILDHIWSYCGKAELLEFSCCSRTCNNLLTYKKYEELHIKYNQLEEKEIPLTLRSLKFTKHLSFKIPGWCNSESQWGRVCLNFYDLINACLPSKLDYLSITSVLSLDGYLVPVFTRFMNLKEITLRGSYLDKNHTTIKLISRCLPRLKSLRKLELKYYNLSDNDFGYIHYLTELTISHCIGLTSAVFDHIGKMEKLIKLRFTSNSNSTGGAMNKITLGKIKGLTLLEHLDLSSSNIIKASMKALSELKSLNHLRFNNIVFRNSIDNILQLHLQLLTHLSLYGCSLLDQDLALLSSLTSLKRLNVGFNDLINTGLGHISKLISLEELNIALNPHITDEGFVYLTTLVFLKKIDIGYCEALNGLCLIHLGVLPLLRVIGITGSSISNDIVENMKILKKDLEFVDDVGLLFF